MLPVEGPPRLGESREFMSCERERERERERDKERERERQRERERERERETERDRQGSASSRPLLLEILSHRIPKQEMLLA